MLLANLLTEVDKSFFTTTHAFMLFIGIFSVSTPGTHLPLCLTCSG